MRSWGLSCPPSEHCHSAFRALSLLVLLRTYTHLRSIHERWDQYLMFRHRKTVWPSDERRGRHRSRSVKSVPHVAEVIEDDTSNGATHTVVHGTLGLHKNTGNTT